MSKSRKNVFISIRRLFELKTRFVSIATTKSKNNNERAYNSLYLKSCSKANFYSIPKVTKHEHAVMALLDVSGYTQLTRQLLEKSATGFNTVEWVGKTVKECLNPIVDIVVQSGGDIVKYAGDSITVLWYNENKFTKAIQCCVTATKLVRNQVFKGPEGEEIRLGLHSVVHQATLYIIYVENEKRADSICFGREYVQHQKTVF